jgi:hypothetical protein
MYGILLHDDHRLFVFDPTGIQFGPEMPLFQERKAYEEKWVDTIAGLNIQPLGTRLESWTSRGFWQG